MNKFAVLLLTMLAAPIVFADESCEPHVSASDLQDGGMEISSWYRIVLPSTLPSPPNDGKPEDCVYAFKALGLPNPRSFLQSNFALNNSNDADFSMKLTFEGARFIKTESISKLTFWKIRFTDGQSETSNVQDFELFVQPSYLNSQVYVGGTWGQYGSGESSSAFPPLLLDLGDKATITVAWAKRPEPNGVVTQLSISVPATGYHHVVYQAVTSGHLPLIEPFSATVGVLSDEGLMPHDSVLNVTSSQLCLENSAAVACF